MTILAPNLFESGEQDDERSMLILAETLGKQEALKIRAIKNKSCKLIGDNFTQAKSLNQDGYGIYYVVNDGGEKDSEIRLCPAFFVEFDDKPKNFQLNFWGEYGLPIPSIQIDSGNKSIHSYWALETAISPQDWGPIQRGLVAWVGSDRACTNLSRCMRAPGFQHQKTKRQCQIVGQSGKKYALEDFRDLIPEEYIKQQPNKAKELGTWEDAIPCPICRRDEVDCRIHEGGEALQCHHGKSFTPPKLAIGQTIQGIDKQTWAYVGLGSNAVGPCSNFKVHESMNPPSPEVQKPRTLADELKSPRIQQWIIEEILANASFVLLGAETGAGKSILLYRIAAAIAGGEPFAGAFPIAKPGKVLILQADESKGDLQKKFGRMELPEIALSNMHVDYLDPGFLGRDNGKDWLVKQLNKDNYVAVFLDSMTTLFAGNGASTKDAEFSLPLYGLTKTFDELGISCMITDHLRKADIGGRREVTLDCIRDSNMKMAAVTDVLGYWVDKEGNRILRALGKRNLTQGTTYTLQGSEEDFSLELLETSTELMPEQSRKGKAKIIEVLSEATEPLLAERVAALAGLNERHAQRLLLSLFEVGEIKRLKLNSSALGGRPKFAYYVGNSKAPERPISIK